jgi:DNA polymerase III epsilon subunit-like protein
VSYDLWYEEPWLLLDTETTGLDSHDRIIQLGLARFDQGKVVATWGSLVWAGVEIPEQATAIHGIRTVDIANAPPWTAVLPKVIEMSRGAHPAAYNEMFDKRMFASEMARLKVEVQDLPLPIFHPHHRWIDPLVWTRSIDRFVKGTGRHKLFKVCERRGIPLPNAHDAVADAVAAGQVLWDMRHEIGDMTVTELLRQQQLLSDAQERQFAAWRARSQRGVGR